MSPLAAFLAKIQAGQHLSEQEAEIAISEIMEGRAAEAEVRDFLLALKAKGECLSEVVGAAKAMRAHALSFSTHGRVAVDTCGTGGDGLKTVNISTMAAFVVAGAGVAVAKHGNRAISSACGSADLLEGLGISVDVEPQVAERCLQEAGFGFMFAPRFHPAMKVVAPIRKALGVPTIFNLLGPLTNPAGVQHQVVGVADAGKQEMYAQALRALGVVRALVVHGADGQDELSTTGATEVIEINMAADPDRFAHYSIVPETFGLRRARLEELRGGAAPENARIAEEILSGKQGAVRDAVVFNAAAALYVAGAVGDLSAGISLAAQSIDHGQAISVLQQVRSIASRQQQVG